MIDPPSVLILTPVKQAASHLDRYFELLGTLEHPAAAISLGFLESDSSDGTFEALESRLGALRAQYGAVTLVKRDFGLHLAQDVPRWAPPLQIARRTVLAKSRNHLLFAALRQEQWVLWLDVDLTDYPRDVLAQMLATGKRIIHPHCVTHADGPTFDWNAWRRNGTEHMDALRDGPALVRLDGVGGTMLMIDADLHRDGLIFPPYLYGRQSRFVRDPNPMLWAGIGEIETEGLGMMAKDMGVECWGMPRLEVIHPNR
jgi:hypothetical protein